MQMDLLTVVLAFLEGVALILSPCILPVLPIILSGSLDGGKRRPFGIIVGFIITFSVVTLFSRFLVQTANINPDLLRNISYGLLILFGLVMLSSTLTDKFVLATTRLSNVGSKIKTNGGFLSGILFGALVGIIWTPCAGPILAAVIVQIATLQSNISSAFTVIAFAIGASIPMLLIAKAGRGIMNKFNVLRNHTVIIRKLLGAILIISVVMLIFFEGTLFAYGRSTAVTQSTKLEDGVMVPYKAPTIDGIEQWINSPPLTLSELKGKVILIDFWTYSCINCLRTLPYLKDWYEKYHDKGFEIIGIHSPEFEFEKNSDNVKNAVAKLGITYPVALDNQFITWRNYENRYWPAHYLIDKNGEVVYEHFGEGAYDVTENNIRYLLDIKDEKKATLSETETISYFQTPEIYLGFVRAAEFSGRLLFNNQAHRYDYPFEVPENTWALQGLWYVYADKIVATAAQSAIKLHFNAGKVYAVMGAPNGRVHIEVRLNDEKPRQMIIERNQLYTLVELDRFSTGTLEVRVKEPGLEIYTFTFGS